MCSCDGTGIHGGLKILWRKPLGFESLQLHHNIIDDASERRIDALIKLGCIL